MAHCVTLRRGQPHSANVLGRARLRLANRLCKAATGPVAAAMLSTLNESDVRASRVFRGGLDVSGKGVDA